MNLATPRWAWRLGAPTVAEDGSRYVTYLGMWWWYQPIFALQHLICLPMYWRLKRQIKKGAGRGD
jgi:hypothetical protein